MTYVYLILQIYLILAVICYFALCIAYSKFLWTYPSEKVDWVTVFFWLPIAASVAPPTLVWVFVLEPILSLLGVATHD